jgi:hypothetical protein
MIKYLGAIGGFVRLGSDLDQTYNFLNIFSSSAATDLLFSASINNSVGQIVHNSASISLYTNGASAGLISPKAWTHFTISFDEKLMTRDDKSFLIRFGDFLSSDFNIQNVYILESSFNGEEEIKYLHKEFTGLGDNKIVVQDEMIASINIVDYLEENFISTSNVTYQPLLNQKRYLTDVAALTEESLIQFTSASIMTNDSLYVDSFNIQPGNRILSLLDNEVYELTASSTLTTVSSQDGDFVKILEGRYFSNLFYLKTSGSFQITQARTKINSYVNRIV